MEEDNKLKNDVKFALKKNEKEIDKVVTEERTHLLYLDFTTFMASLYP